MHPMQHFTCIQQASKNKAMHGTKQQSTEFMEILDSLHSIYSPEKQPIEESKSKRQNSNGVFDEKQYMEDPMSDELSIGVMLNLNNDEKIHLLPSNQHTLNLNTELFDDWKYSPCQKDQRRHGQSNSQKVIFENNGSIQRKVIIRKSHHQRHQLSKQQLIEQKKMNSKNYRDKKKQNYERLCIENKKFQQTICELQAKITLLENEVRRLKEPECPEKQSFQSKFAQDISLLNQTVLNINEEQLLKQQFQALKIKYGPSGCEKRQLLDYHMSQLIGGIKQDVQRYLFMCSYRGKGVFGEIETELDRKVIEAIGISKERRMEANQKYGQEVKKSAEDVLSMFRRFYSTYVDILQHQELISKQNICRLDVLTASQFLRLICWFENNKYCKEVKDLRDEWSLMLIKPDVQKRIILGSS